MLFKNPKSSVKQ